MSVSRHTYSIPIWPADQTTFWLKWTFWLRDSISDKNLLFVHERSETNPSSRVLTFEGEKYRNGLKHALAVGAAISQVLWGAPKNTNPRLWGPQTNPPLKKIWATDWWPGATFYVRWANAVSTLLAPKHSPWCSRSTETKTYFSKHQYNMSLCGLPVGFLHTYTAHILAPFVLVKSIPLTF